MKKTTKVNPYCQDDFDVPRERYNPPKGLETVFPVVSQWHDRILYDVREGKYYDRYSDLYIDNADLPAYGLGY